ncbi:MAG: LysR family transcriptional regulator [Faecousia sp.]
MNIQQLEYLIEIERTRSISQAAANLYMGQPNLSRVLRDTEERVGFAIFERTRKGVRPTEQGVVFLQHARNILREAEFMENLGTNRSQSSRFRLALPRSYLVLEQVKRFLNEYAPTAPLDAVLRECHPRQALELLDSGGVEVAVIRYATQYQDYFSEQAAAKKLTLRLLDQVRYQPVLPQNHPLAQAERISPSDLEGLTEILHRDVFYSESKAGGAERKIYAVDRMAQLQLLQGLPDAYLRSEPLPDALLKEYRLVQKNCTDGTLYQNAVAFKPQCAMSETEKAFLQWLSTR